MIERIALSQGGRVTSVDPATNTIITDFGNYTAHVANVIPPQKAGRIAEIAGAADKTGWCPIDPVTFASKLVPNIHVIGDAAIAGGIPKSASAASAQGKACAAAIVDMLSGKTPETPRLNGACYNTGRAGLCVLAVRRLSARGRPVRRSRRCGDQPGRCAARGARSARRKARRLVQDDHGGRVWLDRQSMSAIACGACSRCPAAAGAQALAALRRRRRRHSGIAHGHARRSRRADARWSSIAPALASSATAAHFPNRSSRATWRRTSPAPAAAGRKASFGCGWSMRRASMPRRSCRPIIGWTASIASAPLARQADPVGRTDRGYRGVSGNAARIGRRRCSMQTNSRAASSSALPAAPPCSARSRS